MKTLLENERQREFTSEEATKLARDISSLTQMTIDYTMQDFSRQEKIKEIY